MSERFLIGPVGPTFINEFLTDAIEHQQCIAFDRTGAAGFSIGPADTWASVAERLPGNWKPDGIILYLPYSTIPECLWAAPLPLVGFAPDWRLLWHDYRHRARRCDFILSDAQGAACFTRDAIAPAAVVNSWLGRNYLANETEKLRDIDILCVENLNPPLLHERLPWLHSLAGLRRRWRVELVSSNSIDEIQALMGRAKIVVNISMLDEERRQAWQAVSAGALLFQPRSSRASDSMFRCDQECVLFDADSLPALADQFLTDDNRRLQMVEAGKKRVRDLTERQARAQAATEIDSVAASASVGDCLPFWESAVRAIRSNAATIRDRCIRRKPLNPAQVLTARIHEGFNCADLVDVTLANDVQNAAGSAFPAAIWWEASALLEQRCNNTDGSLRRQRVVKSLGRAVELQPGHPLTGLNLAEALAQDGQTIRAIEQARDALIRLDEFSGLNSSLNDGWHFPIGFDWFRVLWERAAWINAGEPTAEMLAKRALIRWRLHALLAQLTGDLAHAYEACQSQPDLASARALLGQALLRSKRPTDAIHHLETALKLNPADAEAARSLFNALGATNEHYRRKQLAYERRLLAQAAPKLIAMEAWFADAAPAEAELTSIIIPCCNQANYTRLCLDSVLRHTESPYELILIDNGSTDQTAALLENLRSRPGPVRVEIIRNEANRGFPAACNQGFAAAQGDYFVLLNNDTIVTGGWLDRLIARTFPREGNVGLVGPLSNGAPDVQKAQVNYTDAAGLDQFAIKLRENRQGKSVATRRLSGFCLLIQRRVLEKIGQLDERFGFGFFDDDDLCLRASEAGFRLLVAEDVYVHHFGSRTFRGLGLPIRRRLLENLTIFEQKWGKDYTKNYRLPEEPKPVAADELEPNKTAHPPASLDVVPTELPAAATASRLLDRKRLSLSMIVRNEERHLSDCLASVADLVDEIVIVDTGSQDRTKEIALQYGAKLFDFPWPDSFAAARNESLRHCTGDWVFWLDADDRLAPENRDRLRQLSQKLGDEIAGYSMKVRSEVDDGRSVRLLDQVRLFPRHPQITWRYRVHEQILPGVNDLGGSTRWTDIVIEHVGYRDSGNRGGKLERNLKLLQLEDGENPNESFTLFNLGRTLLDLNRTQEALTTLCRSLKHSEPTLSIVRKLYSLITQAHAQLGQKADAAKSCQEGLSRFPDDVELLFQQALLHGEQKEWHAAEGCLIQALRPARGAYFDMIDAGLRGYKSRFQLAKIYLDQNRLNEAEAQLRLVVKERPDHYAAWNALAEISISNRRWTECEKAIKSLSTIKNDSAEAVSLRARIHLAREEYPLAAAILDDAIRKFPSELRWRVLLTHALLREGNDWAKAEEALQDVLKMAPNHEEAKQNLAILRKRRDNAGSLEKSGL